MPRAISCSAKLSPRHAKISRSPLRTALAGTRLATPPALTTASPSPAQAHLQPFGVLGMVAPARHHQARGPIPARPISPTQHDREVLVTARGRICMPVSAATRPIPEFVLRSARSAPSASRRCCSMSARIAAGLRRVRSGRSSSGDRVFALENNRRRQTGPPEMVPRRDRRIREAGARYSLREPLSHRPPCCAT